MQVVVNPQFALELRDVEDFLAEFGPFNGRYVPRYPSDWASRLKDHANELAVNPVKGRALLERLRREASLCTVPVNWQWSDPDSWEGNVSKALKDKDERIIVGQGLDPSPYLAWLAGIDEIRESRCRSWPFHGAISEYRNACLPLLLNSPAAYLIDAYLDPLCDEAELLLRDLFAACKGSRCYSIHLITRQSSCGARTRGENVPPMPFDAIRSGIRQTYEALLPKDRSLHLHLVTEAKAGGTALRLHDRFFLTSHGAINFGQGFFIRAQLHAQLNAYVVDRRHHKQLKQTYIDGVALYAERLPRISGIAYPIDVNSIELRR